MEKMEFIYTSGWEKFEQYCKELYRGYLNRYCQGNEKACEDEINKAYANIGTDKILNMLKAHSEEIFSCLDSYPEYFKDRLSVLMK